MTNYYPEKPSLPYKKTPVDMAVIIAGIKILQVPTEVKRMTYIVSRNESANGRSIINNNFAGLQADSGRWDKKYDNLISGVVTQVENGTRKTRLFLAFNDIGGCLSMLADKMQGRGLYIGGDTKKIWVQHIDNVTELARAYKKEWVSGSATVEPSQPEINNFTSMYNQAVKLFV